MPKKVLYLADPTKHGATKLAAKLRKHYKKSPTCPHGAGAVVRKGRGKYKVMVNASCRRLLA